MKSLFACLLLSFLFTSTNYAQSFDLTKAYKESTIERLSQLMEERYVFPDVAKKTAQHLKVKLDSGLFDDITTLDEFAQSLTKVVQEINHDKHMRIRTLLELQKVNSEYDALDAKLDRHKFQRENTAGFREVKKLDGNIGYFDLRGFAPVQEGAEVADHFMALLATSDAIIIDLRKNGGGSPSMVQYLCSYFFDKKVHLNSLYWREGDRTDEFWTVDVKGTKLPDVPLFVLTSKRTFSGAEEFSYNMQTQKRATLIGEPTGGGANPGGGVPINDQLMVFIPTGRAINPVTGTNWEGVGVVPDIKTTAEEALAEATRLAQKAAEKYRQLKMDEYRSLLSQLQNTIDVDGQGDAHENVKDQLYKCIQIGLLSESDINQMGYDYLQKDEAKKAEIVLEANTRLFPESPNVFDSYGEVLAENGKSKKAIANFQKAIILAKKQNDPMLKLFQKNLQKAQDKLPN